MVGKRMVEGVPALTLATDGGVEVAFVPGAGMVGCSLRHRGEELLGQRGGLRRYIEERSTMGIPLLHPWANRVARERFSVAGRQVILDSGRTPVAHGPGGLPIHGLPAAAPGWRVDRHEAVDGGGVLAASFDFAAHDELVAAFPFPHEVLFEAALTGTTLTVTTTVHASGDARVPISLGYHPLSAPTQRRSRRLGREHPRARAADARSPHAPDRRARAGRGGDWPARCPDVR